MTQERRTTILGFGVLIFIVAPAVWIGIVVVRTVWHQLLAINPSLATGLVTAFGTLLVATVTVVLGRYFERKKEVEGHYREKKTEIYNSFLVEFFKLFNDPAAPSTDLVPLLREWQRQMILWGGPKALAAYIKWRQNLTTSNPNAQTFFLMEDFFRELRRDLGLSNRGLERGTFTRLMMKHPDLFLEMAKANPNVTLGAVAEKEKELGLQ